MLGHVLLQYVVGEVERALDVRVVRAGHSAVNTLVGPRDKRLVTRHVLRGVGGAVPERLGVEDAETLVDTLALLLHLQVDRAKLAVQLAPILRVGRAAHLLLRAGQAVVGGAAEGVVTIERRFGEGVGLVGAHVEDELIALEEVVYLIQHQQHALAHRPHLVADGVVCEGLLERVEGGDEYRLHGRLRGRCRGLAAVGALGAGRTAA
mmetsp:Transcript_5403/g.12541  ORF Transcript_5403/g.12541 Transcript_5403/m.12541 type:complete len:207 (-) Transcript_5403:1321-1941(-)